MASAAEIKRKGQRGNAAVHVEMFAALQLTECLARKNQTHGTRAQDVGFFFQWQPDAADFLP